MYKRMWWPICYMYKVNDENIGEGVGNKRHDYWNLKYNKNNPTM